MMMDKWTDQLSAYIDGDLSSAETEALEAHLMECAECGRALVQLRAVVARAGQVIDRPPETDLWPEIRARMAQPVADSVDAVTPHRRRRISFSVPQLAAASVALMLLSAGTVYMMVNREVAPIAQAPVEAATQAGAQNTPAQPATITKNVQPANVKSVAAENYTVAINDLEAALETGRTSLDTGTVRVLEKNLRTIDAAIAEARNALGRDPGNPYLNRYLDQTMQRKIQLLRRATGILRAQT